MAETLRTEEEYLALMPVGVSAGTSCQDLRDALYSLLRAYFRDWSEGTEEPEYLEGRTYYRDGNLNLMTQIEGVVRQLGEELQLPLVHNDTGVAILNGTVVYVSGAQGNRARITPASNDDATAGKVIAVVTADIAENSNGYCTAVGMVRDLNTQAWAEGTEVYLGTGGAMTSTKPTGMTRVVSMGFVTRQHPTLGEVLIVIKPGDQASCTFGLYEARPLTPSTSFSDLYVWSWTDEKFPALEGQRNQTDWTVEAYRDTSQLKAFFRYNQDNELHGDVQMPHEWAGTAVRLHLHTIPMAAGTGDVYWSGSWFFGNATDELPANASWTPFTTTQSLAPGDQYVREIVDLDVCLAPASPTASAILSFTVARLGNDALDTYTTSKDHETAQANLCVESFDVHYQRLETGTFGEISGTVSANPTFKLFDPRLQFGDVFLQAAVKSVGGNECEFRLWDETGSSVINGTAVSTSTDYEWIELGPLTLVDGLREYRVQARYTGTADEPVVACARFSVR